MFVLKLHFMTISDSREVYVLRNLLYYNFITRYKCVKVKKSEKYLEIIERTENLDYQIHRVMSLSTMCSHQASSTISLPCYLGFTKIAIWPAAQAVSKEK